jgi:hypothetical protein
VGRRPTTALAAVLRRAGLGWFTALPAGLDTVSARGDVLAAAEERSVVVVGHTPVGDDAYDRALDLNPVGVGSSASERQAVQVGAEARAAAASL